MQSIMKNSSCENKYRKKEVSRIHHLKKFAMKCSADRTADKEKKKIASTCRSKKNLQKNPYLEKDYEKIRKEINRKRVQKPGKDERRRAVAAESGGSTRPRQRNIRIKDTEGRGKVESFSLIANERAMVVVYALHGAYTEARRSGDLDSRVICEARCVVPLSRTSCTLLRRGLRDQASRESAVTRGLEERKKGSMGKR